MIKISPTTPILVIKRDGSRQVLKHSRWLSIWRKIRRALWLPAIMLSFKEFSHAQSAGYFDQEEQRVEVINANAIPVSIVGGVTLSMSSFTALSSFEQISMTVAVVGGTGSVVFSSTGTLAQCSIVPPVDTAGYDFDMVTNDSDEFPVFGSTRKVFGRAGLIGKRYLIGSHRVKFDNATVDGTYKARCVVKK